MPGLSAFCRLDANETTARESSAVECQLPSRRRLLRHREPTLPRPYKAFGYPVSTAVVLVGSVVFLLAAITEDPRSGLIAAVFIAGCVPAYSWMARGRRLRAAQLVV
jgi:hypothetical protein